MKLGAALGAPHPHGVVLAAAHEQPAVRRGRHRSHALRMASHHVRLDGTTRTYRPLMDDAVMARREQPPRARKVADALQVVRAQARQLLEQLPSRARPNEHIALVQHEQAVLLLVDCQTNHPAIRRLDGHPLLEGRNELPAGDEHCIILARLRE